MLSPTCIIAPAQRNPIHDITDPAILRLSIPESGFKSTYERDNIIAIQDHKPISIWVLSHADSHLYSLSSHMSQQAIITNMSLRIISDCTIKFGKISFIISIYVYVPYYDIYIA